LVVAASFLLGRRLLQVVVSYGLEAWELESVGVEYRYAEEKGA
jgi:hypothetical protein